MYTSDPYEPSRTIGIYETEEQRQSIIDGWVAAHGALGCIYSTKMCTDQLFEEEIQLGVYYP